LKRATGLPKYFRSFYYFRSISRQAVKVRFAPKTAFLSRSLAGPASPLLIRQGMPAPKPIKKLKT